MDSAHSLDHIVRLTSQTDSFREVAARLANGQRHILFHGLPTTLAAFLASHLRTALERPVLIVAADEDRAEQWRDDLQVIAGEQMVYYFPAWDVGIYDRQSPDLEITSLRVAAAARLMRGAPAIVVAPGFGPARSANPAPCPRIGHGDSQGRGGTRPRRALLALGRLWL